MKIARWTGAAAVLGTYLLTMARDLSLFDSAELALVAIERGLGHPPGQPLHTLVGYLMGHLPGLAPLVGLNALSAIAGAACVVPAARIAERLSPEGCAKHPWLTTLALAAAALLPWAWEPSTRVEVYSLAALLSLWGVERVLSALNDARERNLIVAAALMGLSACCNPVTALSATLSVMPALLASIARRQLGLGTLLMSAAAGVAGLLPYAYVPWVADRTDALVWGAPTNASALWSFFSGHDYARNTGITFHEWLAHVGQWLVANPGSLGFVGLAMLGWLRRRQTLRGISSAPILALTSLALICANHVFRVDNPDYHGYLMTAGWLCAAGLAAAITHLAERRGLLAATAGVVLIGASVLMTGVPNRASDQLVRELVEPALQGVDQNAIVIVESDHWIAPALYLQRIETLRPDVVVLGAGLTSSSWYWDLIARAHPTLAPFALRGPGGREGRVRRFIDAQARRPLYVESLSLAQRIGLPVCVNGALLRAGACQHDTTAAHAHAQWLMQQQKAASAPLNRELIAELSLSRGEDLWRLGYTPLALLTLLAGCEPLLQGVELPAQATQVQAPPLQRPALAWRRERVLGDPARNLYVAGELLFHAGLGDAAKTFVARAALAGLPEAQD